MKLAFNYLESKKEKHENVKYIKYESLNMATYLKENSYNYSVQERQHLFQCRMSDIDLRAHRKWKYEDTFCITCKDRKTIEKSNHILECKIILNANSKISYLTSSSDLYSSDIQEQIYASNMIRESLHIRDELKKKSSLMAHVN